MTYLQLVNKVLVRLREAQVTSVSENDTSALIGVFVEEALSEVEDTRDWNALRTTIVATTIAGTTDYTLTDAGTSFSILQVHENTEDYDLHKAPSAQWMTHRLLDDNRTAGQPLYYDINGVDAAGDPVMSVYPEPDLSTYQLNVNIKVKTQDLTDSTVLLIPELPVILRAYQFAIDERGDDQGDTLVAIEARYARALADAATYDAALTPDETVWYED